MTDREIRDRRAELEKLSRTINEEWKAYDARYPVEVGAYKPPDYDRQQLRFLERGRDVSKQIADLPTTKKSKVGCALLILAVLCGFAWLVWHFFAK